ncbi:unnamed protein product [Caenorhabditis angaria]|uniref:Uncharacterized protein n=1 Tax=Caenorhabditis angaria TaxID=860376 RepID=A0A9P1IDT5_9PELO|nr:unnamed protein product [Caenorhabditis angaria]
MSFSSQSKSYRDVILLEDTPSPPSKPPRGVLRKEPPMKPQRSFIRIEPAPENEDKENAAKPSQFKAKEAMEKMQDYFKRSIGAIRSSSEFTGKEATDIMEAYILKNKDSFKREDVGRKNAVLLLELWRSNSLLKSVHPDVKTFVDCDRTYFILTENDSSLFYANSPASSTKMTEVDTNSLQSRSTRRNNSFKRLFSPLVKRNRSNSRGRDDKESTFLKSTLSLFSTSDRNEKKGETSSRKRFERRRS